MTSLAISKQVNFSKYLNAVSISAVTPHCESQELLELGGPTSMYAILPTLSRAQRQERAAAGPALSADLRVSHL